MNARPLSKWVLGLVGLAILALLATIAVNPGVITGYTRGLRDIAKGVAEAVAEAFPDGDGEPTPVVAQPTATPVRTATPASTTETRTPAPTPGPAVSAATPISAGGVPAPETIPPSQPEEPPSGEATETAPIPSPQTDGAAPISPPTTEATPVETTILPTPAPPTATPVPTTPTPKPPTSTSQEAQLSLDMDPSGPGVQICRSVPAQATFDVDVVVTNVTDLAGFDFSLLFPTTWIASVVGCDVRLLLASPPGASVIDVSDPLPDSDGIHHVAAVNFGPAPGASGSGVLARLTLLAAGAGHAPLNLDAVELADSSAGSIAIGSILGGSVHVGEPCP